MMNQQTVKFYLAYNSPFASLANTHIKKDLAPFAATLEYKPVYCPRRWRPSEPARCGPGWGVIKPRSLAPASYV